MPPPRLLHPGTTAPPPWETGPTNSTKWDSVAGGHTVAGVRARAQELQNIPSAYWLDVMSKVQPGTTNDTATMAGILTDASAKGNDYVVLIVYDLPNRDCKAKASNGEYPPPTHTHTVRVSCSQLRRA